MGKPMNVNDLHREQIRKNGEKAERKAKIKFTVKWFGIGLVIGFVATWLTSCGTPEAPATQETTVTESVQETVTETVLMQETQVPETPAETVPVTQENTETQVPETSAETVPVTQENTETVQEAPATTWHSSTKEHNITVDSILSYDGGAIWNFNDCTAVGAGITSHVIVPTEADYGFIVTVIDSNTVEVKPYNNTSEYIVPVKVTAELSTGNLESTESYESYTITGYDSCTNGFGAITVGFSDGYEMTAGVFKENGRLYAVNMTGKQSIAEGAVDRRMILAKLMKDAGITEEDCVSTDPIYYPIVPVNKGEVTDTEYWIQKSSEITQSDWTDAHKIMTFYNYVIDNFAYDNWIVAQGSTDRCFYYDDYTGKYYISQTKIGVCEDFSQVIAIMCRAQGIPALVFGSEKHAVAVAYIKDYGRWLLIDSTADIENDVYGEDYTVWTKNSKPRYKNFGYTKATGFNNITIGNDADMKKQGIQMFQ